MSYSYYPAGMSREDLIYVGEIEDEDAMPEWFDEMVSDLGHDDPELALDLWEQCKEDGEDCDDYRSFNHAWDRDWARDWLEWYFEQQEAA